MKVISRQWRAGKETRLYVTLEDNTVVSCDSEFKDWRKEEPSDQILSLMIKQELEIN